MRNRRPEPRFRTRSLAVLLASLLLAIAVQADEHSGTDVIRAKDVVARTLLIGDRSYLVGPRTQITDASGGVISLEQLDVMAMDAMDGLVPLEATPRAHYEARPSDDGLVLIRVDLLETRD